MLRRAIPTEGAGTRVARSLTHSPCIQSWSGPREVQGRGRTPVEDFLCSGSRINLRILGKSGVVDVVGCSASNFAGAALSRPHAGRARKSRGNLNEVVIKKQSANKQQVVDRFLPPYPRALQEGEAVRNKVGLFPHWGKGCFGELCSSP
jgi:hypothetical protein